MQEDSHPRALQMLLEASAGLGSGGHASTLLDLELALATPQGCRHLVKGGAQEPADVVFAAFGLEADVIDVRTPFDARLHGTVHDFPGRRAVGVSPVEGFKPPPPLEPFVDGRP